MLGALRATRLRLTAAVVALDSQRVRPQLRLAQGEGTTSDSVLDVIGTQGDRPLPKHQRHGQGFGLDPAMDAPLLSRPSRSTSQQRRIDATARNLSVNRGTIGSLLRIGCIPPEIKALRDRIESVTQAGRDPRAAPRAGSPAYTVLWRSSTLTSSIDTSASSSSRAEEFLGQWPSIGTCQQQWLIGLSPLLGSTPSTPPAPPMAG